MMARPLTPLSDPMTGFFGIRRGIILQVHFENLLAQWKSDVFARAKDVSPIGFKIAMELYVKAGIITSLR